MVCMSPVTAPGFADEDPLIGPWLAHARDNQPLGDSVLWHAAVDLTGQGKVQAMLGMAGVLRSGVNNPRFVYLPIDPDYPGALDFARAVGATHLTDLDARIGDQAVQCYRMDYGPGGLLTTLRAQVYRELSLPAPSAIPAGPGAAHAPAVAHGAGGTQTAGNPPAAGTAQDAAAGLGDSAFLEVVRDALRNFQVPRELSRGPLAAGTTVQERAETVRRVLRQAVQEAFGESETEKLLRDVLIAGYLEPMRSHEAAASALCLSRAAYFRRLRTAVSRVAEHLTASHPPP